MLAITTEKRGVCHMKRAAYDCVGAGAPAAPVPAGGAVGDDELSKPFSLLIGFGIGAKCGGCGLTEAAAEAEEEPS